MGTIRALTMPKWGIEMREGKLAEWLVKEGQAFQKGQLIALIETDKITNEVEAEFDSTLRRIITPEGETKAVGALLAILAEPSVSDAEIEAFANSFKAANTSTAAAKQPARAPASGGARAVLGDNLAMSPSAREEIARSGIDPSAIAGSGRGGRITRQDVDQALRPPALLNPRGAIAVELASSDAYFASPLAKRLAALNGIDLGRVQGTGRRGRISKADVLALLGPGAAPARIAPMSSIRRVIARRLTEAKSTIPHFYLRAEARADALLALRAAANASAEIKASLNDYIVRAVALALMQSPDVNVQVHGDAIHHFDTADISIAVASEKGLMTPILRGAQALSVAEIAAATKPLIAKAQAGRLSMAELEGGSFTISNLGMFGIDQFDAIINPPQGAILAVGGVRRVFAEQADGNGRFESRIGLSMSCDHRAIDGATGAKFLGLVKALIEAPEGL